MHTCTCTCRCIYLKRVYTHTYTHIHTPTHLHHTHARAHTHSQSLAIDLYCFFIAAHYWLALARRSGCRVSPPPLSQDRRTVAWPSYPCLPPPRILTPTIGRGQVSFLYPRLINQKNRCKSSLGDARGRTSEATGSERRPGFQSERRGPRLGGPRPLTHPTSQLKLATTHISFSSPSQSGIEVLPVTKKITLIRERRWWCDDDDDDEEEEEEEEEKKKKKKKRRRRKEVRMIPRT